MQNHLSLIPFPCPFLANTDPCLFIYFTSALASVPAIMGAKRAEREAAKRSKNHNLFAASHQKDITHIVCSI